MHKQIFNQSHKILLTAFIQAQNQNQHFFNLQLTPNVIKWNPEINNKLKIDKRDENIKKLKFYLQRKKNCLFIWRRRYQHTHKSFNSVKRLNAKHWPFALNIQKQEREGNDKANLLYMINTAALTTNNFAEFRPKQSEKCPSRQKKWNIHQI